MLKYLGLLIIEILCIVGIVLPDFPNSLIFNLTVSNIILLLSTIWLVIFVLSDIKTILSKSQQNLSPTDNSDTNVKSLFVIGILGYIILEITSIEVHLIKDSIYSIFILILFTLLFSNLISELVLVYGFD